MSLLILLVLLILPGWAFLSINQSWKRWEPLQRWCLAISLGIAFYPIFFYWIRVVFPFFKIDAHTLQLILVLFAVIILWRFKSSWRQQLNFDHWELLGLLIIGATLFTRLWIIRDYPYPAWSDSLHHTIITLLTATQGKLPVNLEPYFPIPLGMYHLGLYSITGSLQILTQEPAHAALIITSQTLNGLCPLGIYLFLDRKVDRPAAVLGALIVGLISFQPAWYFNWGRFTQIASQTILLTAILAVWENIRDYTLEWGKNNLNIIIRTIMACFLSASLILLHFRVAAFFISFLTILIAYEIKISQREGYLRRTFLGLTLLIIGTVLLTFPALKEALHIYIEKTMLTQPVTPGLLRKSDYFSFSLSSIPLIAAPTWLLIIGVLAGTYGTLKGNRVIIGTIAWIVILLILGNLYVLGIGLLAFTNLGAVFIMLYLPMAIIIGTSASLWIRKLSKFRQKFGTYFLTVSVLLLIIICIPMRIKAIEPYRHFITPSDLEAVKWIKENIPEKTIFAVNTTFWLPDFPHGTDAGYWIPYLTGHQTTTSAMLFPLASNEYRQRIVNLSKEVINLNKGAPILEKLRQSGVKYIYIGKRGNFSGPGLQKEEIQQSSRIELIYDKEGVSIFKIN
jgi:hypothetical protein